MVNDNIIQFNTYDDKNVWTCISTFLDRTEQNSKRTRMAYEKAIGDFFKTMRNKELENLIESDLVFSKPQIETYQVGLRKRYKSSSVNQKMTALKKCYIKLEDYGFEVKSSWFEVDTYKTSDKESYDKMTHQEVIQAINLVSNTRAGEQKAILLRLAYATAFRKESLLKLKWDDFFQRDGVWFVKTLGKGQKWDYKKISNDLYVEVMRMKEDSDRDELFTLTDKTIKRMMDFIRKNIDFGNRNIVFHSLKKSSIEEVALLTNFDIKAMQQHANHSSASTTINSYIAEKSLDELIVIDIDYNIPIEKLDSLSKDDLLSLIKKSDRNTQMKLLHLADML